jgi:hypothetical protein
MKPDLTASQLKGLLSVALGDDVVDLHATALERAADAATPLDELVALKHQAKTLIGSATDHEERAAAQVLYHAAVAGAFVHHGTTITSRSIAKQRSLYADLAGTVNSPAVRRLFTTAAARLADDSP